MTDIIKYLWYQAVVLWYEIRIWYYERKRKNL